MKENLHFLNKVTVLWKYDVAYFPVCPECPGWRMSVLRGIMIRGRGGNSRLQVQAIVLCGEFYNHDKTD